MLREEIHGVLSDAYMMIDRIYVIIGTTCVLTQEPLHLTPRGVTASSQIHPKRHSSLSNLAKNCFSHTAASQLPPKSTHKPFLTPCSVTTPSQIYQKGHDSLQIQLKTRSHTILCHSSLPNPRNNGFH